MCVCVCGCGLESEACMLLLHSRAPLQPRRFVLLSCPRVPSQAHSPLAQSYCRLWGHWGSLICKGQSIVVQDYADEMMPSLRTRLHLAVRDAATECTEPVEQRHQGLGAVANKSHDSPARLLMPHAEGRSMENTLCKQRTSKSGQQKA